MQEQERKEIEEEAARDAADYVELCNSMWEEDERADEWYEDEWYGNEDY